MAEQDHAVVSAQDQLLRRPETARELKVCVRTLERWARQGIGPKPFKMGPRAIRYRRSDINRWLEEQATGVAA